MTISNWNSGTTGAWSTASNWSAGVPDDPTADATIAAAGNYDVNIGFAQSETVDSATLNGSGATLDIGDYGTLALAGATGMLLIDSGEAMVGGIVAGGTVDLEGGTLDLSFGTLFDTTLLLDGGSFLSSQGFLQNVTVGADLLGTATASDQINAKGLNVVGGTLNVTGGGDSLTILDNETLDNLVLNLGNHGYSGDVIDGAIFQTLTFGAGFTLVDRSSSYDTIGDNYSGTVINLGTVVAGGSHLAINTARFSNQGTMLITGVVVEQSASFDNAESIIVGSGGDLVLGPATFANTGTIIVETGGVVEVDGSLDAGALGGIGVDGGIFEIGENATLALDGGTLLVGPGGLSSVEVFGTVAGGTIAASGGSLSFGGAAALEGITYLGTFAPFETNSFDSEVGLVGGFGATGPIVLAGGSNTLTVLDSETLDLQTLTFAGSGNRLSAANGKTLTLGGGFTIDVSSGAADYIGGSAASPYSNQPAVGVGTIVDRGTIIEQGNLSFESGAFVNAGSLIDVSSSLLLDLGTFINQGLISLGAGARLLDGATSFANSGSIPLAGRATFELAQLAHLGALGSITGAGTFLVDSLGTLALDGATLRLGAGSPFATFQLGGTISGGTIDLGSGTLQQGGYTYGTLDAITLAATTELFGTATQYRNFDVEQGLTFLSGTLNFAGAGDSLTFLDSETLDQLAINFSAPGASEALDVNGGTTLTLGAHAVLDIAADASAVLGTYFGGAVVNQGTIVDDGTGLTVNGSSFTNAGTLIDRSPRVAIQSRLTTNDGVISVAANDVLTVSGELANSGTILLSVGAELVLSSGVLAGDLGTIIGDHATLSLQGGFVDLGGGTLDLDALGISELDLDSGASIGNGTLLDTTATLKLLGGTLSNVTYDASVLDLLGTATSYQQLALSGGSIGGGTLNVSGTSDTLIIPVTETLDDLTINLGNSNGASDTLQIGYNTTLGIGLHSRIYASGNLVIEGGGLFDILGTLVDSTSNLQIYDTVANAGTIVVAAGDVLRPTQGLINTGSVVLQNGAQLVLTGYVQASALGAIVAPNGTLVIDGTLDLQGTSLGIGYGLPIGQLQLAGSGTIENGTIADNGQGFVNEGGALLNAGVVYLPYEVAFTDITALGQVIAQNASFDLVSDAAFTAYQAAVSGALGAAGGPVWHVAYDASVQAANAVTPGSLSSALTLYADLIGGVGAVAGDYTSTAYANVLDAAGSLDTTIAAGGSSNDIEQGVTYLFDVLAQGAGADPASSDWAEASSDSGQAASTLGSDLANNEDGVTLLRDVVALYGTIARGTLNALVDSNLQADANAINAFNDVGGQLQTAVTPTQLLQGVTDLYTAEGSASLVVNQGTAAQAPFDTEAAATRALALSVNTADRNIILSDSDDVYNAIIDAALASGTSQAAIDAIDPAIEAIGMLTSDIGGNATRPQITTDAVNVQTSVSEGILDSVGGLGFLQALAATFQQAAASGASQQDQAIRVSGDRVAAADSSGPNAVQGANLLGSLVQGAIGEVAGRQSAQSNANTGAAFAQFAQAVGGNGDVTTATKAVFDSLAAGAITSAAGEGWAQAYNNTQPAAMQLGQDIADGAGSQQITADLGNLANTMIGQSLGAEYGAGATQAYNQSTAAGTNLGQDIADGAGSEQIINDSLALYKSATDLTLTATVGEDAAKNFDGAIATASTLGQDIAAGADSAQLAVDANNALTQTTGLLLGLVAGDNAKQAYDGVLNAADALGHSIANGDQLSDIAANGLTLHHKIVSGALLALGGKQYGAKWQSAYDKIINAANTLGEFIAGHLPGDNFAAPGGSGASAGGSGDVHLITFDGLHYDFQAAGEFVFAQSPDFAVQIRLVPISTAVTIITAVAVKVGQDTLTFDEARAVPLHVDGVPQALSAGQTLQLAGATLYALGGAYVISYNTGEVVTVANVGTGQGGGAISVGVHLGSSPARPVSGLLGNDDGNASNDISLPDGTVLTQPVSHDDFYHRYADQWRVTPTSSAFDYDTGKSTASYTIESFPTVAVTAANLPSDITAQASLAVAAAGITDPTLVADAVLDYVLTGGTQALAGDAMLQGTTISSQLQTSIPGPTETVGIIGPASPTTVFGTNTGVTFEVFRSGDISAAATISYAVQVPGAGYVDASLFGGSLPSGNVVIAAGQSLASVGVTLDGSFTTLPSEILQLGIGSTDPNVSLAGTFASAQLIASGPVQGIDAAPAFELIGGGGTLTHVENGWTLDFGEIGSDGVPAVVIGVLNTADALSDSFNGSIAQVSGSGFTIAGETPLPQIAPGSGELSAIGIVANTGSLGPNTISLDLHPLETNSSGYVGTLADQYLTIIDDVVSAAPQIAALPATLDLYGHVGAIYPGTLGISDISPRGSDAISVSGTATGGHVHSGLIPNLNGGDMAGLGFVDTSTIAGTFADTLTLALTDLPPNGSGRNASPLAPPAPITLLGTVYNYATAALNVHSTGLLSGTIGAQTLDLGTLAHLATATIELDIANSAIGLADTLAGAFDGNFAAGFMSTLSAFGSLAAGGSLDAGTLTFGGVDGGTYSDILTLEVMSSDPGGATSLTPITLTIEADVLPCFVAGSRIALAEGACAVEALREGDFVRLADGTISAVRWIGQRRVACDRHPRPDLVWPVRIEQHAFGRDLPQRDLLVSPDHALFVAGVLIPARHLLNGASIRQERVAAVHYYHVELERHAVLLAEGLPAESYLDTGNRHQFAGAVTALHPDFAALPARAFAKLVTDGPDLEQARRRLLGRLPSLGYHLSAQDGLLLEAGGRLLTPLRSDGAITRFLVPRGVRRCRILSSVGVPAALDPRHPDTRGLGACLTGLLLDGRLVPLDDTRLEAGFWPMEGGDRWRWTDGAGEIALAPGVGPRVLEVCARETLPGWVAAEGKLPPDRASRNNRQRRIGSR